MATMKRSGLSHQMELQELQDKIAVFEKKQASGGIQSTFPPLPKLESVREVLCEGIEDDDARLQAVVMADDALRKAEEEIASLQKAERQRGLLESQLAQANVRYLRMYMCMYAYMEFLSKCEP